MHTPLHSALKQRAPLGRWYAEPVPPAAAESYLKRCETRRQRRLRRGVGEAVALELGIFIARHHLGNNSEAAFQRLKLKFRRRHSPRALALLYLIYGQLLAAQQLPTAGAILAEGFRLATPLLHADDYFALLNRHQLLAQLPGVPQPEPLPLAALLSSAAVKQRLESLSPRRPPIAHDKGDLYG